jgi:dipeptidyl aminopeptidase/acylaminoacyl peptidase
MTTYDLDTFLRQPRLGGLALSPDGRRLVVAVATAAPDGQRFRSALWSVDPAGEAPPRQLTRSAPGEATPTFTGDGTLLFTSARPDPDATFSGEGDPPPALWALPADGGEARLLAAPPAGVDDVEVARAAEVVLVHSSLHPRAASTAEDREREEARQEAGVTAQLFDTYPIRHWDRYLGPREPARLRLRPDALTVPTAVDTSPPPPSDDAPDDGTTVVARGEALRGTSGDLTPDGTTYVTSWRRHVGLRTSGPDDLVTDLVAIDVVSGERRTVRAETRSLEQAQVSPDGRRVAVVAEDEGDPDRAARPVLAIVDLADGTLREVATHLDRWPSEPRWLPDGDAIVFCADDAGHRAIYRVDLDTDEVTRLTATGHHSEVQVAPDGTLFALRCTVDVPHHPVRLEPKSADQEPLALPSPASAAPGVARVERLVATADDGVEVPSWLVLPADADGPVPLVVFIHGGPLGSWNMWTWRWNPNVFAAAGYAVLLPDPALSTGYGQDYLDRGWGRWGERPYTDVMTAVDAAAAHPAVDGDRLAATGGSFGGYLANWVAGHTDRFRCIVTHASLWALEPFHGTTDLGVAWEAQFGDPYVDPSRYVEHSPHRHVGSITSPVLVIHGERDLRVPISEALTLWTDLARHGVDARFLYFPDEHHWVLKPQNARLWYRTFLAFLGEHLRDEPFERPELL